MIGVNIEPWTEDTYYITCGTISGNFFADGGVFHISGGHFTNMVMFNNGNDEASLEIDISGDAELDRLEHMIYSNENAPKIHMAIGGNARIKAMLFEIIGGGTVTDTVLTVNGGYFGVDPGTWLNEVNGDKNVVQIQGKAEQYTAQTDWTADTANYTWRVRGASELIAETFEPDSEDTNFALFRLPQGTLYAGLKTLGVQRKTDNSNDMRFVSVISSDLLALADDYGYVFTKTSKSTQTAKDNVGKLTVDNGHKYSCKDTHNTMTGAYGDPDAASGYKYVTAAINNIGDDDAIVGRFFITINGTTYYGSYTDSQGGTYSGFAARLSDLQ